MSLFTEGVELRKAQMKASGKTQIAGIFLLVALSTIGCQSLNTELHPTHKANSRPFINGYYRAAYVIEKIDSGITENVNVTFHADENLIEDAFEFSNGGSNLITYAHDEFGRLVTRTSRKSGSRSYTYNRKGLPKVEVRKYRDGRLRRREYHWNLEGQLYKRNDYTYNSNKSSLLEFIQYNYQYDNKSRLLSRECKNIKTSRPLCLAARYTVDEANRVVERTLLDPISRKPRAKWKFTYDSNGNLILRENYDDAGELVSRTTVSFEKSPIPVFNRYLFRYAIDP